MQAALKLESDKVYPLKCKYHSPPHTPFSTKERQKVQDKEKEMGETPDWLPAEKERLERPRSKTKAQST